MERVRKKENFESAIAMMEKLNHSIGEIVKVLNSKKEESPFGLGKNFKPYPHQYKPH